MWLDRKANDQLMAALEGTYGFLPQLVRHQPQPGLLDLRFRSRRESGRSEATLYLGERAALRLRSHPITGLTVKGPARPLGEITPEGHVHARLCARTDAAILDREIAFRFSSKPEKNAALNAARLPFLKAVGAFALANPEFGKQPTFGQEVDAIAIESGRLAIIEVKAGTDTRGICWAAAQVSFYARLFSSWVDQDPDTAHAALADMLEQRVRLGLAPEAALGRPIQIVPVVAVGLPVSKESDARSGAIKIQSMLLKAGIGWPDLELWAIAADGRWTALPWFSGAGNGNDAADRGILA
jgi:hypothetical protein